MPLLSPRRVMERSATPCCGWTTAARAWRASTCHALTERFYRVEGQKSGERMGTGLGLAIVKHIVNRHRGGFFVESAPNHGAAFSVYLPMTTRAVQQAQAEPSAAFVSDEPRAA